MREIADVVKFEIEFDPQDKIDLAVPTDFKPVKPERVKRVCIVEDDIKLTEEEKEVLKEMLAEKKTVEEEKATERRKKADRSPKK